MTFFVISSYQHLIQNIFPKPQKKMKWSIYKLLNHLSNKVIIINYLSIKMDLVALCVPVGGRNAKWLTDSSKTAFVLKA